MGRPYSQDLRDRVIATVEDGQPITACARLLRVSVSYVSKVMGRKHSTGETAARRLGSGPVPKLAGYEAVLRQRVAAVPDETLKEFSAWLRAAHGVTVSLSVLCRTLHRLDLSHKKSRSMRPSRRGPTSPPGAPRGGRNSRS
jgi:transposase